jgi:hypothetical protein
MCADVHTDLAQVLDLRRQFRERIESNGTNRHVPKCAAM